MRNRGLAILIAAAALGGAAGCAMGKDSRADLPAPAGAPRLAPVARPAAAAPAAAAPAVIPTMPLPIGAPESVVRVIADPPAMVAENCFAIEYRIEGGAIERLELWVTPDGGARWRLFGYDPDGASPFEVTLDDGEWGLWWVVAAVAGASPSPQAGDAPQSTVAVDTQPPAIEFGTERVLSSDPAGHRIALEIPFTVADPHLEASSIRAEVRIDDAPWRTVTTAEGRILIEVPPARVRVRIAARDGVGHSAHREHECHPAALLVPPRIAFVDPTERWVGAGQVALLAWEGAWPAAPGATVLLESRTDGGTWRPIAAGLPLTGSAPWQVPRGAGPRIEVRVRLDGGTRREDAPQATLSLAVDASPPVARIVAPAAGRGEEIPLLVDAGDAGGAGLAALSLWRWDGGGWSPAGESPPASTVVFRPPQAGEHRLWIVARDAAGLESEPPPADPDRAFLLTVEGGARTLELLSFQDGASYPAGGRHWVFFRLAGADPSAAIVHLEWSGDDGASWSRRVSVPAGAGRAELVLPRQDIARARVRIIADELGGGRIEARSRVPFRVDGAVPEVIIEQVRPVAGHSYEVHFTVQGGRADSVGRIVLYHRAGNSPWQRWPAEFSPRSPIRIALPAGSAVVLRAVDRAGNEGAPPDAALAGRAPVPPVPPAPGLEVLSAGGRAVAGGSSHYIFFRSTGVPPSGGVRLEERVGADGEWREVRRGPPASGRLLWTAPVEEDAAVWLRLVSGEGAGELIAAVAEPFTIDGSAPIAHFAGPESSRGRTTAFEARLPAGEGLERVEAWVRHFSTPHWERVAEAPIGQPLEAELADGMYHVAIVAVDRAGNRSDAPDPGSPGQGHLLVDTVPPQLLVDEPTERVRLRRRGDTYVVRPRVTDANLSPFPLSFRIVQEGSLVPEELKRYHPNATEFAWSPPASPGVHTLEVVAEDLAGNRAIERIPVTIIPAAPRPRLAADPTGLVLSSGEELSLVWSSEGVEPSWPGVRIELTADGEAWETVGASLPADGSLALRLPQVDSNRCRVRLEVVAPDGMRGVLESGPFTISSTAPRVRAAAIRPAPPPGE